MISPERLTALQGQWVRLLTPFGVSIADAYAPFDRLVAAYSEAHRHYHTLEHLAEMFRVVGRLSAFITGMPATLLAVWYHDVVYDPRAHDNEEKSADWANTDLKTLGMAEELRLQVRERILATKHSCPIPHTEDLAALLDADLAILGSSEARYTRYAADIRKENEWVPEEQYRTGRRSVLMQFLQRERIYLTPLMFEEGEVTARQNLQREIDQLS